VLNLTAELLVARLWGYVVDGVPISNFNDIQFGFQGLPGVSEEVDGLLDDFPKGLNSHALYVVWAGPNDFFLGLSQPGMLEPLLTQAAKILSKPSADWEPPDQPSTFH